MAFSFWSSSYPRMRFVFSTVCGGGILLLPLPNRYALPFFAGEDGDTDVPTRDVNEDVGGCIIKRSAQEMADALGDDEIPF